jgi:hypothetical protein
MNSSLRKNFQRDYPFLLPSMQNTSMSRWCSCCYYEYYYYEYYYHEYYNYEYYYYEYYYYEYYYYDLTTMNSTTTPSYTQLQRMSG